MQISVGRPFASLASRVMIDEGGPAAVPEAEVSTTEMSGDGIPASSAPQADDGAGVPPAGTTHATGGQHLQFAFTGRAGDYFRIWIVNLLLTLVTVGFWSPWAKVRKRRWFYGHTWAAGANFEYHADPVAILRGRLIAAAAVGVYWVFDNLVPGAAPWVLSALFCGAPWIIARSLAFNAANSSHCGVRFRFAGTPRDVVRVIWPIALWLVLFVWVSHDVSDAFERPGSYAARLGALYLALFVVYPYTIAGVRRLTIGKSAWGSQPFVTTLRVRKVYAIYLIGLALCIIPLIVVGAMFALMSGAAAAVATRNSSAVVIAISILAALAWAGIFVVWTAYNRSRMTNLVLGTARLSNIAQFHCALSARALAKLYIVNLLAILGTCGLLIPWAVVRLTRYRLRMVTAEVEAPLESVTATVTQDWRATGEELGEMFGIDVAL
jgi:uncharacterized membrane protein YjgN (DUF898 family)